MVQIRAGFHDTKVSAILLDSTNNTFGQHERDGASHATSALVPLTDTKASWTAVAEWENLLPAGY